MIFSTPHDQSDYDTLRGAFTMTSTMGRRTYKQWAFTDTKSKHWKATLCYLQRPGVSAKIKRIERRNERREAKKTLRCDFEN